MADITGGNTTLIGGNTHTMDAKAAQFVQQANDFRDKLAQITSTVRDLEAEWWGRGSLAYQDAMNKWDRDARQIVADLDELTKGLKGGTQSLSDLDSGLQSMFRGLGG